MECNWNSKGKESIREVSFDIDDGSAKQTHDLVVRLMGTHWQMVYVRFEIDSENMYLYDGTALFTLPTCSCL